MSKIAMIVSNPCTGDARVIKMAESAAQNGHEVHVFATIGKNAMPYEVKNGVVYHRIEWKMAQYLSESIFFSFLRIINKKFYGFIVKKISPFIKYTIFSKIFSSYIAELNPSIIHAHDLICLPTAFDSANLCTSKPKIVYDAHELEVHRHPPLPFFQKRFVSYIEKKFGKKADTVITVGKHIADILSKELNKTNINILYNSPIIEKSTYNIRNDLNLDPSVPIMLYVGKITLGRGINEILPVLPLLPLVHYVAVGPADIRTKILLEKMANKLNVLDRFHILPPVPNTHVVEYIKGADIGVILADIVSLSYQYSMPNKLFEMSFANIPIITTTELEEISEFVLKMKNGKSINFNDKNAILYQLSIFMNERENYKLTNEKKKELEENYSWTTQENKLLEIYKNLLKEEKL